ncbi:hypothetical protein B0H63DRAFT_524546 [Podospora didyma]|uniref:WD-like domain-containing protein n=1 Tax=Podospora didyma TaxID=330526 RepID=A0AAE0TWE2_9PEZI|nr:hypothetical protein B0H63DRAFT_524546 [Podospora didyma]
MHLIPPILLALLAASNVLAMPVMMEPESAGLSVIHQKPYHNGNITIVGFESAPLAPLASMSGQDSILQRGCGGSNNVECHTSYQWNSDTCQTLINFLNEDPSATLAKSPRSVCFGTDSATGWCCLSWSKVVNGLQRGSLVPATQAVFGACAGTRSGLARDVNLQGVCLTQCLSGRAEGCR